MREHLLSVSEAGIAAHLRRKGCVGDAALRGSDQGEPPERFPHLRNSFIYLYLPSVIPHHHNHCLFIIPCRETHHINPGGQMESRKRDPVIAGVLPRIEPG